MINSDAELREVTKLVLYGWGYPTLFNCPNGTRLRNRLVSFPLNASPVIQGTSKQTHDSVLSRLEFVAEQYLDCLRTNLGTNPVWIWVDTPESLSSEEILTYRKQFEEWVRQITGASSRDDGPTESIAPVDLAKKLWRHLLSNRWQRAAIVIFVFTAITLTMMHTGGLS